MCVCLATFVSLDHCTSCFSEIFLTLDADGFPQFNQKYGEQLADGSYQVPARWQAGLSNVSV